MHRRFSSAFFTSTIKFVYIFLAQSEVYISFLFVIEHFASAGTGVGSVQKVIGGIGTTSLRVFFL